MDVGTLLSVAQTLLAALECFQLKEMCSFLGYQSELVNLQATVATVKAVLEDAEAKRELSHEAQCYIEELKDVVYDADDLIDEFVTWAQRKHNQLAQGQKVSEKVRRFFSRFKHLNVARNMSHGVKEVRERLDAIASNHNRFGFKLDSKPIRKRREETCSYVYEQDIIGREDDKEKIVGTLLDSNVQRDVSFLTIVGIGGLGKTTLAQLVYNDQRVTKHFDLRLWACVSDEDPNHLDVKAIVGKVLESASSMKYDGSSMDVLQCNLREKLVGKKYLLVLDDVWNENREEWLKFEKFLKGCLWGSWVVVTTRSKKTAEVVSNGPECDLKGLSEENSWRLFERVAFEQGEGRQESSLDLIKIGKEIVKKCANVPLAIRVVGSLLYGQGPDKWQSFQEIGLGEIRRDENAISHILMLSYHNLDSRLKSCFSYCAIFPKDSYLSKEMLISLWMAQGYIVPFNKGQSMEDAAEEYFSTLLRRCFFQNVKKAWTGEIMYCNMHDLMYDIAQEVARKEVFLVNSITSDLDRKTRHVSYAQKGKCIEGEGSFTHKLGIRTCLLCDINIELPVGALLANWMCLRTLDLHDLGIKCLPGTIGKLLHLRYLDLSNNRSLESLPKSITKLLNLQTLKLSNCSRLIELPNDLSKLVNLRLLYIRGCSRLTHMPPYMGKLSCLQWLNMFVVGDANSSSKQGVVIDQLEDLEALNNLRGKLEIRIRIPKDAVYVKGNTTISDQGGYLRRKMHLNIVEFTWKNEDRKRKKDYEEALLEDMQPHPNLKELDLIGYGGKPPSWMKDGNFETVFSNLVSIIIRDCHGWQHFPSLGKLPHLRWLEVRKMRKLEYMEDASSSASGSNEGASFFPSLEALRLQDLPKLKGWWRDDDDDYNGSSSNSSSTGQPRVLPSFPRLSQLKIYGCPELARIPLCPTLEELSLVTFNERLQVMEKTNRDHDQEKRDFGNSKLMKVQTNNLRGLKSALRMPMEEAFQCLSYLTIEYDSELESMEQVWEVIQICSSSLHTLHIWGCENLKSLSMSNDDDDDGEIPWRSLQHTLRSMVLAYLPKVVKLPKGMQYLTSLQYLEFQCCKGLESVPEWMPRLTSLAQLYMWQCSEELKKRCQSPHGEDWPHIQHIPSVTVD